MNGRATKGSVPAKPKSWWLSTSKGARNLRMTSLTAEEARSAR